MNWYSIDDHRLTAVEEAVGTSMAHIDNVLSTQMTALDERAQPTTTVLVLHRPTETLLISVRADRSIVIATDDDGWS